MDITALRLYPDPDASLLVGSIAEYYGVDKSEGSSISIVKSSLRAGRTYGIPNNSAHTS